MPVDFLPELDLYSDLSTIVLVFENSASTDLAMGRSSVRRRILTLLAQPETRLHLREIQRRAGTSPGTASRELGRLVAAGLIEREAEGNQVYFRAATTPLATLLRSLLTGLVALRVDASAPAPEATIRDSMNLFKPTASGRIEPANTVAAATAEHAEPASARATATPPELVDEAAVGSPPDEIGLDVAARLAARIRPAYGERLLGIYLYGARARGEARPDSTVDILLVLDHVERYGEELELTSAACAELSLEESVVVSRVFVSESAWRTRSDGQLPAIRKEAVAV
jgi:predicted nucleotidyltransferase/DNA-binding transcriptional ArsR family regulator